MTRRMKCTVAYNGARYKGWQTQREGNAIQDQIETSIARIANKEIRITGSGRTDAGVSASHQVFMFDTEMNINPFRWISAINAFLPDDIHIMGCEEKNHLFHARHNVHWKEYIYRINTGPYDVFTKDRAYQYGHDLDIDAMKEASEYLIGRHNFTSFNASPLSEYPDQTRTILNIEIRKEKNEILLIYRGKGFLQYMVRMMSGALIEVGAHRIEPIEVKRMLEKENKQAVSRKSPACGLTLEHVEYFDVIAMSEEGYIREFMYEDLYEEGDTEEEVMGRLMGYKHNTYLIEKRPSGERIGTLTINEQNEIEYQCISDLVIVESLVEQVKKNR